MSKQPPPAPTASAIGPCPTILLIVGRPGTDSIDSDHSDSLDSEGRQSSVTSTRNQSEQSSGTSQIEHQVGTRRSGWTLQPPN